QRGRQGDRPRPPAGRTPPVPGRAAGVRTRLLRAGAEGGDGGHSDAGGGVRAVVPRGGPGRGDGTDAGGLPARRFHERVRGRGPGRPAGNGRPRLTAPPPPGPRSRRGAPWTRTPRATNVAKRARRHSTSTTADGDRDRRGAGPGARRRAALRGPGRRSAGRRRLRSEEHTSELQSRETLVC